MTALAVNLIGLYQAYLSPLKGFSCAHRIRSGGRSCSQIAKRLIGRLGLGRGLPLVRRQLQRCRQAAHVLRERATQKRRARSRRRSDAHLDWTDCCHGADCGGGCDPGVDALGACDLLEIGACLTG